MRTLIRSNRNFVVIYPNNDPGFDLILDAYQSFIGNPRIRVLPSVRFEYFLSLLKSARFIVGNSSAGVREAPVCPTPAINVGSRQQSRSTFPQIIHCGFDEEEILSAIHKAEQTLPTSFAEFGGKPTSQLVLDVLRDSAIWEVGLQKTFVSIPDVSISKGQHCEVDESAIESARDA